MAERRQCVVIFESTYDATCSARLAKNAGFEIRMLPVPRKLSSDCNMGMVIAFLDKAQVASLLEKHDVECRIVEWSPE